MIYKTFEEWKAGQWLEDGEPRTEAYTEDELLLVEMGWKYGFDAGKQQQKPLSDEEIDEVAKNNFEGVGRLIYMIVGNVKGDDFRQAVRSLARAIEERHGIE